MKLGSRALRIAAAGGIVAGLLVVNVGSAGAATSTAGTCTTVSGTGKIVPGLSLTPTANVITAKGTATGCTVLLVDVVSTNGSATNAKVVAKFTGTGAVCVGTGTGITHGKTTIKWQNAGLAPILNVALKPVSDQTYTRLDKETGSVAIFDDVGIGIKGPHAGYDTSLEFTFDPTAGDCLTTPVTAVNFFSDGTSAISEVVGSDGALDDLLFTYPS